MPRLARLDAPGVLHHVMGRGTEKRKIFRNDRDRNDFIGRLSTLTPGGAMEINAWVLMPNYFHLLCKTKN
ncbi:transposase, partial [Desulfobacteraceae bacterium SEEP-SAG9]